MTADNSAGDAQPTAGAEAAGEAQPLAAEGAGDLPFHALAIAADPALSGVAGQAFAGTDADVAWQGDAATYDGHVALALDPSPLPDIDTMLDLLTVSHDLFDVPAMDVGGTLDDSAAA